MKFIKRHWILVAIAVVVLYSLRIQIAEKIYETTGGKISLFGVHGGSI